jgi:hypothetical protein
MVGVPWGQGAPWQSAWTFRFLFVVDRDSLRESRHSFCTNSGQHCNGWERSPERQNCRAGKDLASDSRLLFLFYVSTISLGGHLMGREHE